jgi:hypothetical protein
MITQLYTYYDRIACQSEFIFHARNDGDAQRHFVKRFENRNDSDEFQLLHIGSIDHDTSKVTLLEVPESVEITLPNYLKKENDE